MKDIIMILVYAALLLIGGFGLSCGLRIWYCVKKVKNRLLAPPSNDTLEAAKEIGKFLKPYYYARFHTDGPEMFIGGDMDGADKILKALFKGEYYPLIHFIRNCHDLGCEVVVRRIGTDDLTLREDAPQVISEIVSKMSEETRNGEFQEYAYHKRVIR